MKNIKSYWRVFFLATWFPIANAHAQIGGPQDNLDLSALSSASIATSNMSFDVPFSITGPVPSNCYRIDFCYELIDEKAHEHKHLTDPFRKWVTFKGTPWQSFIVKTTDTKFLFQCAGIHPNLKYRFTFQVYRNVTLDDNTKKLIRNALATALVKYFEKRKLDASADNQLNSDLNTAFSTQFKKIFPTQDLKSKSDPANDFVIDFATGDLKAPYNSLLAATGLLLSDSDAVYKPNGLLATLKTEAGASQNAIIASIAKSGDAHANLTAAAADYLKQTVTPALTDFKGYTVANGIALIKKLLVNPGNVDKLLNGKIKISNQEFVPATGRDLPSIVYLGNVMDMLAGGAVMFTDADGALKNVFDSLTAFNKDYQAVLVKLEELDMQHTLITNATNNMPDLSLAIAAMESVSADNTIFADVTTQNSPYLSAEGGLGYAHYFNKGFSYYGANLYLYPVNKKAVLGDFNNWRYRLRKQLCVNIGIVNFFGDRPQNTTSLLGASATNDLMLGLGYRLNRIMKINADWLFVKTSNFNALTGSPHADGAFVVSLGIDVNLLKGVGDVAKALKITN